MVSVWLPFFLFVLGLCVGSFLNVVTLRFGFAERGNKRSECMSCSHTLAWFDLIPLFSFFLLRGRCRYCGSKLSFQYPLVELTVGVLFLLSASFVPTTISIFSLGAFVALLLFLAAFTALVAYDIRHTLVPVPFLGFLIGSAVVATVFQSLAAHNLFPLIDSAEGALALGAFFAAIVLVTRGKGMGMGDAYVAFGMGAMLGLTRGIEAVMLGIWIGTAFSLILLFLSSVLPHFRLNPFSRAVTMKTEIPLAPFLALGTALALFTDISPLAFIGRITSSLFFGL